MSSGDQGFEIPSGTVDPAQRAPETLSSLDDDINLNNDASASDQGGKLQSSKPALKPWIYNPYSGCPINFDVTEMTYEQYVARHYELEREKMFKSLQSKMQENFVKMQEQMMQINMGGMMMPQFGVMPMHMNQMGPMSMPNMPHGNAFFPPTQYPGHL